MHTFITITYRRKVKKLHLQTLNKQYNSTQLNLYHQYYNTRK